MSGPVLYITFDGVLQPLAFSQVVRVVAALAKRGFRYHLLSVERTADLEDTSRVHRVERVLAEAGVAWTPIAANLTRSALRSGEAFVRAVAGALGIVRRHGVVLVHARGYQGSAVASVVRKVEGIPYLFDARGFWIDEKTDWFGRPAIYAMGKLAERRLYAEALAVVTLTELHAREVVGGVFGAKDPSLVVTIPTCADYDEFRLRAGRSVQAGTSVVPVEVQRRLGSHLTLGIIGALNQSYLSVPTLALVARVLEQNPDAHLLVLSHQRDEYAELLRARGIAPERHTVVSASHGDMPSWLDWIDWGLLLLNDSVAKRGSMPTKLAEFFAAGVRPVAYGCNSEMTNWVRRAGSGIVLDGVDEESLRVGARHIASFPLDLEAVQHARNVTAPHFSLASGIRRYEELIHRLLARAPKGRGRVD